MEQLQLDNGLRILLLPEKETLSASVSLWVTAGSRWEEANRQGISHFLEHMAFKGTARRTARQVSEEMDLLGGGMNAYTAREYTRYYAQTLAENAGRAMELLCDIVLKPRLDEADMERERGVILEEMAMYEDNGEEVAHDAVCAAVWPGSSLGRSICGTRETVSALTVRDLQEYRRTHYAPERLLAVAAGRFDRAEILDLLEREAGALSPTDGPSSPDTPAYRPALALRQKELEQTTVELAMPGLPRGDSRRYAMMLFNFIAGGGASSRLFQRVREELGLAYSVYSSNEAYTGTGLFTVTALTSPERQGEVLQEIRGVLDSFSAGVTQAEFERARAQVKASYILGMETVEARASYYGRGLLFGDRENDPVRVLERLDALTPGDVDALAQQLLPPEAWSLAVAGATREPSFYDGFHGA
ncbi:MAG: insulinase family protein [Clostridiales bacterium]|nr:insulinase family protein [Clostridiales bacterium]